MDYTWQKTLTIIIITTTLLLRTMLGVGISHISIVVRRFLNVCSCILRLCICVHDARGGKLRPLLSILTILRINTSPQDHMT